MSRGVFRPPWEVGSLDGVLRGGVEDRAKKSQGVRCEELVGSRWIFVRKVRED